MATGLTAAWQGMQAVTGDRTMPRLKKAFGQYNAYEDPKFYRDLQMFEQNPTAQRADMMLKEYGDTLDAEDKQALLSKITPMEGTPQYYDWQNAETQYNLNQNQLEQSNIRTEAMPELTDIELGLQRNNLQQSNIQTEGMQEYYMPTKALEFQMLGDQADMTATEAENFGEMQDLQMEAQQLSNNYQQLQNEWKQTTDPIKKQQLEYDLQLTEETLDDRIAQIQAQSQQAQTQADYSQRTLDDRVALAGEQALSAALGNEIQQAQKPALINQPYLQNTGTDLNNQLRENELWQSNRQKEFLEGLGDNELMSALGFANNGTEEAIDIKYTIPNPTGNEPLAVNQSDIVVNRATGQPFQDQYGQYYKAEKDFFSGNVIYSPYGGQGNPSEMTNVLMPTTQQPDFDTEPKAPWYEEGWETFKNYISGDNGNNQDQPQTQPGNWNDDPKFQPRPVIDRLMQDNNVSNPKDLITMLNNSSSEKLQTIQNAYGYSPEHLIYILSNM